MARRPDFYDDLAATHRHAWTMLEQAVADRDAAFHTVQVASLGLDDAPRVRTVVLRAADAAERTLRFHTDARSPKAAELTREPRVEVLAYDPAAAVQLRLSGAGRVEAEGTLAQSAWVSSRPMSRKCYRIALAPGTPIADPYDGLPPDHAQVRPDDGRAAFCIVRISVTRLDWLFLAHEGHRRARFGYGPDGTVTSTWLVP